MRVFDLLGVGLVAPFVSAQEGKCSELHLIYARATTEAPTGMGGASAQQFEAAAAKVSTKGFGAAGFSLLTELTKLVPAVSAYPVNYPADWSGCANSESKGVNDILRHLSAMAKACPNQKYVLGGHSQGAVVTTTVVPRIPKDLLPKVLAVTMFGAPPCPAMVKDRCKSYCNKGDDICDGTPNAKAAGKCGGSTPSVKRWFDRQNATEEVERLELNNAWLSDLADSLSSVDALAECSGDDVPEKGHQSSGYAKSYNRDAFYTKAAACYILKKLKIRGA